MTHSKDADFKQARERSPGYCVNLTSEISTGPHNHAFHRGQCAFQDNKGIEACPFPAWHPCQADWHDGYRKSAEDYLAAHEARALARKLLASGNGRHVFTYLATALRATR